MNWFIVLAIIALSIMVVISLVRGLAAFLQASRAELEPGGDVTRSQTMQNRMMFARIKYQALAVAAIAVLLLLNR